MVASRAFGLPVTVKLDLNALNGAQGVCSQFTRAWKRRSPTSQIGTLSTPLRDDSIKCPGSQVAGSPKSSSV
jgi:hypothetical protein